MTTKARRGAPLKSGERRKPWNQRLPVSTIEQIRERAAAENKSQADVVAEAMDLMCKA